MFVAYINRDPTRFKQHLLDSFNEHLQTADKPKRVFAAYGTLDFPVHLKKADVHALADNVGNNIAFSNFDHSRRSLPAASDQAWARRRRSGGA